MTPQATANTQRHTRRIRATRCRYSGLALIAAVLLTSTAVFAETVTCPCTADTWLKHNYATGIDGIENFGGDKTLTVTSRNKFALMNFDVAALAGMTVEKATLRLHVASAESDEGVTWLHTVGISTISGNGPWGEGTQAGGRATPGQVNWFFATAAQQPWAFVGSDITDVTFGLGGSLYAYVHSRDAGDGWREFDLPPDMVQALATGDQFGLMVCDEKGQTWTTYQLSSRESDKAPILIVQANRIDTTPPGAVVELRGAGGITESTIADAQALNRTTLQPGSVVLRFGKAGDDAGQGVATHYDLRYATWTINESNFNLANPAPRWCIDPIAPKQTWSATANALTDTVTAVVEGLVPGQVYHVAARAIDEAGNAGPVAHLGQYRAFIRDYAPLPAKPAGTPLERAKDAALAPKPTVWAVPELTKVNPRTGELMDADGYSRHRQANAVWDAAGKTIKLTGARNEFVACQLVIEPGSPVAAAGVVVDQTVFGECQLPAVFAETGAVQLARMWYVPNDPDTPATTDWYGDGLAPLDAPFAVPATDNGVPGQTAQAVFIDVYIPHDAKPGLHNGSLKVSLGDAGETTIKLAVEVLPITLPDKLNFIVDLNCYGGINGGYRGISRGTDAYTKLAHEYHRLTHLHRTNLNVLGYGQSGNVQPDHVPALTGEGADTRVADWSNWDDHFAPLLDGSAFKDLPRAGVPIPDMYLAFHENWPSDIHKYYKFDYPMPKTMDEYTAVVRKHAMEAAPIQNAFDKAYGDRFAAVVAEFAKHIKAKGWTNTDFQVYLNNKYYWKRPRGERLGGGSAWWLLDEPNHRDDILALSYYADLVDRGLADYPDAPIIYRTDISRIYWIRDLLTDQLDLNCMSRKFYEKNRYVMDHRNRYGRAVWNYGSLNHPSESSVDMRAWCWRTWLNGGDGLLPWDAVGGGANAWNKAEKLTAFYPGFKFGVNRPFPSLRLKALRRGQQDVEYLCLLADKTGWDRDAVATVVGGTVNLKAEQVERFVEDAGTITFDGVDDTKLDQVRLRVAAALMAP